MVPSSSLTLKGWVWRHLFPFVQCSLTEKPLTSWMCFFDSVPGFNSVSTTNTDKPHSNRSKWLPPKHFLRECIHSSPANTLRTTDRRHHTLQGGEFQMWPNTQSHLFTVYLHPTYLYQFVVFNNHPELRTSADRLWICAYLLSPSSASSSLPCVTLGFPLTSSERRDWGFYAWCFFLENCLLLLPGQLPLH